MKYNFKVKSLKNLSRKHFCCTETFIQDVFFKSKNDFNTNSRSLWMEDAGGVYFDFVKAKGGFYNQEDRKFIPKWAVSKFFTEKDVEYYI